MSSSHLKALLGLRKTPSYPRGVLHLRGHHHPLKLERGRPFSIPYEDIAQQVHRLPTSFVTSHHRTGYPLRTKPNEAWVREASLESYGHLRHRTFHAPFSSRCLLRSLLSFPSPFEICSQGHPDDSRSGMVISNGAKPEGLQVGLECLGVVKDGRYPRAHGHVNWCLGAATPARLYRHAAPTKRRRAILKVHRPHAFMGCVLKECTTLIQT